MLSRVDHDPSTWQEPPEWAKSSVEKLCKATGFDGPVGMAVNTGEWPQRVGVSENPPAYATRFTDPDIVVIFLPPWAEDNPRWWMAICHEFMHVLHMPFQQFVWPLLTDEQKEEWTNQLEVITKPLTYLLMVSQLVKVEVVSDATPLGSGVNGDEVCR